ncbi:uncharacterized protein [Ptychodera flava]|uniref:uncharacterized protein n=1 Tax=Ptychodera flava TaxID=63121 RepID=UPI00396A39F2
MAGSEYISFALRRQIRLVFAGDVRKSQQNKPGAHSGIPGSFESETNLTTKDCQYIWEEVQYADKIQKLGQCFEESSKMLLQHLQDDQLTQKDKRTLLNFLCQYGAVNVTMESSRPMDVPQLSSPSNHIQPVATKLQPSRSLNIPTQMENNLSNNLPSHDNPKQSTTSTNRDVYSYEPVKRSSPEVGDSCTPAQTEDSQHWGRFQLPKKPISSMWKTASRRFKMGKPKRFGVRKASYADSELIEGAASYENRINRKNKNDRHELVRGSDPVTVCRDDRSLGDCVTKQALTPPCDQYGRQSQLAQQEGITEHCVHDSDSLESSEISKTLSCGIPMSASNSVSTHTATTHSEHRISELNDTSYLRTKMHERSSPLHLERSETCSEDAGSNHALRIKSEVRQDCEEGNTSVKDTTCAVEVPGRNNNVEIDSISNADNSGTKSQDEIRFIESVSLLGRSFDFVRSKSKGESALQNIKIEIDQGHASSSQTEFQNVSPNLQYDSALYHVQNSNHEGIVQNHEGAVQGHPAGHVELGVSEYPQEDTSGATLDPTNTPQYTETWEAGVRCFHCLECGKKFMHRRSMKFHMRMHDEGKVYTCKICGVKTLWKSSFRRHLKLHTGEQLVYCQLCGKRFQSNSILVCHMRSHTGERPFKCDVCHKSFSQKNVLKTHMRRHTGEKPHECPYCKKQYSTKEGFNRHIKFHTEKKKFQCDQCDAAFNSRRVLSSHKWIHTVEATYLVDNNGQ